MNGLKLTRNTAPVKINHAQFLSSALFSGTQRLVKIMSKTPKTSLEALVADIASEIEATRGKVRQLVNSTLLQSYWQTGRLIIEHEQAGQSRAAYGKQQLKAVSQHLTERIGWTHYRRLLRINDLKKAHPAVSIINYQEYKTPWTH